MAESKRDYYEVLGVPKTADEETLKKAYRALAKKYHPDANPGNSAAAAMFAEVAEAYSVLSNKQQRAAYDGHGASQGSGSSQDFDPVRRSYTSPYETFHSSVDPEDLFRKIFGADFSAGDFAKKSKRVWVDYAETDGTEKTESTILRLSFREAAVGCEKVVTAKTVTTCDKCMGLG